MLESEAFAIAARLPVAMRRSLGCVTDVEGMRRNREDAIEVIRVARESGNPEFPGLAASPEAAALPPARVKQPTRHGPAHVPPPFVDTGAPSVLAEDGSTPPDPSALRYVGRFR